MENKRIETTQMDMFDDVFETTTETESEAEQEAAKITYEDFDAERLYVYAGIDCIATSELLTELWPRVIAEEKIVIGAPGEARKESKAPTILESFLELEIPAQEFLIDLEINGLGYSIPRNEYLGKRMVAQISDLDDKIFTQIGKKIDLNSGPAVAAFLYGERGFTPPGMTKGGEPATDGQAILTLAGLDPLGGKYVTKDPALQYLANMAVRRDVSSVHNTFIKTYAADFIKRDGRLHPSYNQFGTSSFRITGSDPNLTQLPRARHGYNIRVCYTVRDGFLFISFDFSSAEVKVLSNLSKEPAMMRAIADGLDFHSFSASAMRGIPYDEMIVVLGDSSHKLYKEYKELRQLAKILTFSIDIRYLLVVT